jgi:hypothetical protein
MHDYGDDDDDDERGMMMLSTILRHAESISPEAWIKEDAVVLYRSSSGDLAETESVAGGQVRSPVSCG